MAFAPANMPTQGPNFTAPPQMMQQAPTDGGKPKKPPLHGLVEPGEIDARLAMMPREVQQAFLRAVATMPDIPTVFGIAIGPEAHDYMAMVVDAVQKQAQAQEQNSQGGAMPPSGQNPSMPPEGDTMGGQPPAMATSAPPPGM